MSGIRRSQEELAESLASRLADYRAHDGVTITADEVKAWAGQFDKPVRHVVLHETDAIMAKRYFSKADAVRFLDSVVKQLAKQYFDGDVQRALDKTSFLDLQPTGKSQGAMLALLDGVVAPYGHTAASCGGNAPARYLYVDDVLCTGNTVFFDMKEWWLAPLPDGRPRQIGLPANVMVHFAFLVLHDRNWTKVKHRFNFDPDLKVRATPNSVAAKLVVENTIQPGAALDFAFPRRSAVSPAAVAYFEQIGAKEELAFRDERHPANEKLFTNAANRDVFERAVLDWGLIIIDSLATHKKNMHPLGYTLPSQPSFGFGALAFTWRNVPNNSPLVFWHSAPFWTPLLQKRGNDAAIDFAAFLGTFDP